MLVGLLPTYAAGRHLGAGPAGRPAADPGLRGRRRNLRRELDDPGARAVRPPRLLRQLHAAGRAGRPDPRRRRVPAARGLHAARTRSIAGAGASRSCSASSSSSPATSSGARSTRRRPSPRKASTARCRRRRSSRPFQTSWRRHAARRLHGADERDPGRRDHLRRRLRRAAGLRHRLPRRTSICGSRCSATSWPCSSSRSSATCPTGSAAGRRSSSARWAPACCPSPISTPSASRTCRWRSCCRILMWGVVYQGYNAVFPSFYPELFPTRDPRLGDGDLAEHRHDHHRAAAGAVRHRGASRLDQRSADGRRDRLRRSRSSQRSPPGRARETYRLTVSDLGNPNAAPMAKQEYDRLRAASFGGTGCGLTPHDGRGAICPAPPLKRTDVRELDDTRI